MIYMHNFKMACKISTVYPEFYTIQHHYSHFQARMILNSIILAGMPLKQTICVINVLSEGLQNKKIIKQIIKQI